MYTYTPMYICIHTHIYGKEGLISRVNMEGEKGKRNDMNIF